MERRSFDPRAHTAGPRRLFDRVAQMPKRVDLRQITGDVKHMKREECGSEAVL